MSLTVSPPIRIAVIGAGKTGGRIPQLLRAEQLVGPFTRSHLPTASDLERADVAIVFVPGSEVENCLPLLLEAHIPTVWGSTGYDWPTGLDATLRRHQLAWIYSSNFAPGMRLVHQLLTLLADHLPMLDTPTLTLTEQHRAGKEDRPSGTALKWADHFTPPPPIHSIREGDLFGIHELTVETADEKLTLRHEALDRTLFARGAVQAAHQLIELQRSGTYGFHPI